MKIAHGTLVMVMDGSKMLLLRNDGDVPHPELAVIAEEQADNPPTSQQGTDRPGRTFSSASPRRSAYSNTDWHEQSKSRFVRGALGTLGAVMDRNDGATIILAEPSVLGEFRKQCDDSVRKRIIAEIDVDLVNHVTDDIARAITDYEP